MAAPLLPHPAATAGGALVIYGELEALVRRHEVTLVAFAGASPSDREGLDVLRQLGVVVRPIWRDPGRGLHLVRRRARLAAAWLGTRDPLRALKFRHPPVQAELDAAAAGSRFDLVHVEDSAMGQYRYPPGVPAVLTEQDVRDGGDGPALEAARWRRYQTGIWRRFDRLQVYTERDAARIKRLAPDLAGRVRVNAFGVALDAAAAPATEQEDELVFVGGFHHRPNVDAACWLVREILPLVWRCRGRVCLTIVGADPPRSVRALASDRVSVTGFVPAVSPFLDRAAVVLAPLRTGSGMRVKVLQAMARCKAVVATSLAASGLAPDAPLVLADTAPQIADAVVGLLSDVEARRGLGRRARAFIGAHHSWEAFAERLNSMYRELGVDG